MKSYKKMTSGHQSITKELYDAIYDGVDVDVVNIVEEGNMDAVTSNAVAEVFEKYVITETGTVYVTVKDSVTGDLLSGITVKVGNKSQVTNSSGKCTFSNIKRFNYAVKVNANGYNEFSDSISLASSTFNYEINLVPGESDVGTVNFQVIDNETRGYISNAKVAIDSETEYTDNTGKCSFTNLKYGYYTAVITHNNYESVSKSFNLQSSSFDLSVEMTAKSSSKSTVSIKLTDSDTGLSIAGAKVTIGSDTQTTDSRGDCTFENLAYGDYSITIICTGYNTYSENISISSETLKLDIKLSKSSGDSGVINVSVSDKDTGLPVSGASIIMGSKSGTTDSEGKYTFTNMAHGTYSVTITCNDYITFTDNFTFNTSEYDYNVNLTPITQTGNVNVTVTSSSGSPIKNAEVQLTGQDNQYTDSSGKCTFSNLNYSTYDISVTHTGYEPYSGKVIVSESEVNYPVSLAPTTQTGTINVNVTNHISGDAVSGAKVTIGTTYKSTDSTGKCSFTGMSYGSYIVKVTHDDYDNYQTTVTLNKSSITCNVSLLPIEKTGTINVSVTDSSTSVALENATVKLDSETKYTDSSGKCTFTEISFGTHSLDVSYSNYTPYSETIDLETASMNCNVKLEATEDYGSVYVTVTDEDTGSAMKDVVLSLGSYPGTTDRYGKYTFSQIPYGSYEIKAYYTGYDEFTDILNVNAKTIQFPISLTPTPTKGDVNFTITDFKTGDPISKAGITLGTHGKETGDDGTCVLKDITFGDYTLIVEKTGYVKYNQTVTVSKDSLDFNIKLVPEDSVSTINLTVKDSDTDNGIEGAVVTINNIDSKTDSEGKCTFEKMPYGIYDIIVTATNYSLYSSQIIVSSAVLNFEVKLTPLSETSLVEVYVKDKDSGDAIESATVQIGNELSFTDSNGYCKFMSIVFGDYDLIVNKTGYGRYSETIHIDDTLSDFTALISKTSSTVNIIVKDKTTSNPISSAPVVFNNSSGTTGSDGICTFTNISYGDYDLEITPDGYNPYSATVSVASDVTNYTAYLSQSTSTGTVNVVVLNSTTGNPVELARVGLNNLSNYTDAQGQCSFTNLAYTTYSIDITHDNYDEYKGTIDLDQETYNCIVKLTQNTKMASVTVGVIDDTTSYPIQDAVVRIGYSVGKTDSYGKYIFTNITYGTHDVIVSHKSFNTITKSIEVNQEHIISAVLVSALDKKGTFNLVVQDESSNGYIPNANVTIGDVSGKTGTDGIVTFNQLPYHSYKLDIDHDSYEAYTEIMVFGDDVLDKTVSLVGIDETGTINVNVTDGTTGSSLKGAKVIVGDASGDTDSSGTCTFEKIRYDDYKLIVTCDGYEVYEDTITLNSDLLNCDVGLTPSTQTSTVKVTVLDSNTSNPVNEAVVLLGDKNKGTTDRNGICIFKDIIYGTYELNVSCDGYNSFSNDIIVYSPYTYSTIDLEPEVHIGTINIKVYNENDEPLPDTKVILDNSYNQTTDSDGKCSFDMVYGTYDITLRHDKYYTHNDHVNLDDEIVSYEFTLTPYGDTGTVNITVKDKNTNNPIESAAVMLNDYDGFTDSQGKISFAEIPYDTYNLTITYEGFRNYEDTIELAEETFDYTALMTGIHDIDLYIYYASSSVPVQNRLVEIYDESKTSIIASGNTDDKGHFEFTVDNLPVQTLIARIHKTDDLYEDVTFSSSETEVDISVETAGISNLTVTVRTADQEKYLPNATITLSNGRTGTTDNNGQYTFNDLDNGTYNITTECLGYRTDRDEINLQSWEETHTVYLKSKSICDYVVNVSDQYSNPVEGAVCTIGEWKAISNENGKAILKSVNLGTYELKVAHNYYDTYTETVTLDTIVITKDVQLSQDNKKTNIYFTIQDSYSGFNVNGVNVSVQNVDTGATGHGTSVDGKCEFVNYARANYEVTFEHGAFETNTLSFRAIEGTYNYTIELVHNPSNVTITAIDSETESIIPNAEVILNNQKDTTDAEGKCTFSCYSGRYNIEVTKDGYYDYSTLVIVDGNPLNSTLKLIPTIVEHVGTVKATVREDRTKSTLENVIVNIGSYSGVTNAQGICYIKSIPFGEYTIKINHEDYDAFTSEMKVYEEIESEDFILTQQNQKTDIYFTVQDDFSGYKINGAHVNLYNTQRKDTTSATTDENGTCSFKGYLRNNYEATITHGAFENKVITINAIEKQYNIVAEMKHNPVTVNVSVINIYTDDPVENASVTLGNQTLTTDLTGKCTFENVYSANHQFLIIEPKYYDYINTLTVDGQNLSTNVKLVNTPEALGTLNLNIYNDRTSDPVPGAKVTIDVYSQTSDETGKCVFENLPIDEYKIDVVCNDYDYYVEQFNFNELEMEHDIRLLQDKQTSNISFTVQDEFSGYKINGANVEIYDTIRQVTNKATTDENGNCSFNGYLFGKYRYSVSHGAFEDVSNVDLDVYEKTCHTDVKLKHNPTTVTVKVREKSTQTMLPDASVTFGSETPVKTDSSGQVVFTDVYSGVYDIQVTHEDYVDYTNSITVDGSPVTHTADLTNETGTFIVNVKDSYKQTPISGATVKLGDSYSGMTDSKGSCTINDVIYTTYAYTISKENYDTVEGIFDMDLPEDTLDVSMTFRNCTLNIIIKDTDTGKGVRNAAIKMNLDEGGSFTGETDADGKCTVKGFKYGTHEINVSKDYYESYSGTVNIDKEETTFEQSITGYKCTFTIHARDSSTKDAIAGAKFAISGDEEYTGTTGTDGSYMIDNVQCGTYTIALRYDNYRDYTDTITLDSAIKEYYADMTYIQKGTVYVTVQDSTLSTKIQNAMVMFDVYSGTTNKDGICSFSNIEYGTYSLDVFATGYDPIYKQSVTVNQSATYITIKMVADLSSLPSCMLTITDNNGTPISEATVTLDNDKTTTTNKQGICIFKDVDDGKHKVKVVKDTFKTKEIINFNKENNPIINLSINDADDKQVNIKAQLI